VEPEITAVAESAAPEIEVHPHHEAPRGVVAEWTVTIILLLFGTTTLMQAFVIPTGSMEDTLLIGDHLIVDKLSYAPGGSFTGKLLPYSPIQRGDIIVFRYPIDTRQTFVKRAIGLPGDRLKILNKQLYLNGQPATEPYKYHKTEYFDSYRDNFPSAPNAPVYKPGLEMLEKHVVNGEVVVPDNHYFALGDNRDLSLDSRYWGFIPRENIVGKPLLIYWSYDAPTERLQSPMIGMDHARDLTRNFFTKTRWERTFQLIHGYRLNP
jgi:signal peptidase I